MGGKTSKILSHEEAVQRCESVCLACLMVSLSLTHPSSVSEEERAHVSECFRRMGRSPTSMDKSTFIRHVVAEIVPDMYLEVGRRLRVCVCEPCFDPHHLNARSRSMLRGAASRRRSPSETHLWGSPL